MLAPVYIQNTCLAKMVLLTLLRKITREKKKKKIRKQKVLSNWEAMYEALQNHPLTQAKIINEQLLQSNQDQIDNINKRLDSMEGQINEIETRMNAREKRKRKKSPEPEEVPQVIGEPQEIVKKIVADAQLSDQEKSIVKHLKTQEESDAETIAEQFKISRSNASLKLNKLYNWGFLDKRLEEKTVFYKIKD